MPEPEISLPRTWRDRLKDFRARRYASSRFQTLCARFLLTRPIARANAASVFDLCAGFAYSQVLYACVKLGLLLELQKASLTLEQISARVDLPIDGAGRLVRAASALKILEARSGDRFGLGPIGAAVLGNPGLQSMIIHNGHFYKDLADPVSLLKERTGETELANYWAYSRATTDSDRPPEYVQTYSDLMSQTLGAIADEVINAYPVHRHKRLLDVGGGNGAFLEAVASRVADIDLILLDLPPVAQLAKQRLSALNLPVEIIGADMFAEDWPDDADLITLVRVALDHDDDAVGRIYEKARRALRPGCKLLIAEPMSDSPKVGDGYFGLYLWAMGSGRPRSIAQHRQMLQVAGFRKIRVLKTAQPMLVRLIIAETN